MSNGKLYNGDEHLSFRGQELPYSIIQYWRLNLSELLLSITRGGFAEFLVLCALNSGGFDCINQLKSGIEPWDIDGPKITIGKEPRESHIEVKCTASIQLDTPPEKEPISLSPTKLKFNIAKKKNQSLSDLTPKRNNDMYVFAHYTAQRKTDDILNLDFWEFYTFPTFRIEEDPSLEKQNTISIWRLRQLGVEPVHFDGLSEQINHTLSEIENHYKNP